MSSNFDLKEVIEFDWNEGNIKKSEIKHKVFYKECEEVFLDNPYFFEDKEHSINEKRFHCIGLTKLGRLLFISFTMRDLKVRVISARVADKREKQIYEKAKKTAKI